MTSFTMRAAELAKLWLFSFVLVVAVLAPGLGRADGRPIDRIVVFGTSLSDPGNAFALSGQNLGPSEYQTLHPLLLIPDSETPYAVGGNRHSNGPTWIEQLAKRTGLSRSVKPAWRTPPSSGAFNYAVAGTRARDGVANDVSLSQQLAQFFADNNRVASPNALYVVEMGSNDVADVIFGLAGPEVLFDAATSVGAAIGALYCAGASKFLVWNVPNFGRTPGVININPFVPAPPGFSSFIEVATATSTGYNSVLSFVLQTLKQSPPCNAQHALHIIEFDAFARLGAVINEPEKYGLQDVRNACVQPTPPFACSNPDRRLFWDGIHPTQAGHAVIAAEVVRTILGD